jgi:purine-nucleoside phosphorylase
VTPVTGEPQAAAAARSFGADAAIVSGSGLAVVPEGFAVVEEIGYERLAVSKTPVVAGHFARLLLLAGRPHLYEGWSATDLERAVTDVAGWGVSRLVLTCACGGLVPRAAPGSVVVVDEVVDLQTVPIDRALTVPATTPQLLRPLECALRPHLPVSRGRYVAVPGPQYETPSEARWLAGMAAVVGMSVAVELRAARRREMQVCLLALVVNRAGCDVSHAHVVDGGARLAGALSAALADVVAQWPLASSPED